MDARKRKFPGLGLNRRVRARADPEPEEINNNEHDEETSSSEPDEEGTRNAPDNVCTRSQDSFMSLLKSLLTHNQNDSSSSEEDSEIESGSEDKDEDEEDDTPQIDTSAVSFGALARAQASMGSNRKRKGAPDDDEDEKSKSIFEGYTPDLDAKASKSKTAAIGRNSKHAPAEMTSKNPVSRYREAIAVPKRHARDPRFDASIGNHASSTERLDEIKADKAYAFLDDYRETEMAALREAIKGPKPAKGKKKPVLSEREEKDKEKLKRALASMESRKKAKQAKEAARAVIDGHRKRERELVAQGKKPFYLKEAETKRRVLLDKFAGMSDGQVDRAVARKRKKIAGKEKKSMPFARRGAEE